MTTPFVILVTGSRTYKDWETAEVALEAAIEDGMRQGFREFEVRHGDAEGADKICGRWVEEHTAWYEHAGVALWVDVHRPDWDTCKGARCKPEHRKFRQDGSTFCPTAALLRDDEMVDGGAHICLAFIDPCAKATCRKPRPHGSHGASYTADRAEKAGILVRRFPEENALRATLPERTPGA